MPRLEIKYPIDVEDVGDDDYYLVDASGKRILKVICEMDRRLNQALAQRISQALNAVLQ